MSDISDGSRGLADMSVLQLGYRGGIKKPEVEELVRSKMKVEKNRRGDYIKKRLS